MGDEAMTIFLLDNGKLLDVRTETCQVLTKEEFKKILKAPRGTMTAERGSGLLARPSAITGPSPWCSRVGAGHWAGDRVRESRRSPSRIRSHAHPRNVRRANHSTPPVREQLISDGTYLWKELLTIEAQNGSCFLGRLLQALSQLVHRSNESSFAGVVKADTDLDDSLHESLEGAPGQVQPIPFEDLVGFEEQAGIETCCRLREPPPQWLVGREIPPHRIQPAEEIAIGPYPLIHGLEIGPDFRGETRPPLGRILDEWQPGGKALTRDRVTHPEGTAG
jgi:hypothetical protein